LTTFSRHYTEFYGVTATTLQTSQPETNNAGIKIIIKLLANIITTYFQIGTRNMKNSQRVITHSDRNKTEPIFCKENYVVLILVVNETLIYSTVTLSKEIPLLHFVTIPAHKITAKSEKKGFNKLKT
jgi:hypothetical protein